MSSPFCRSRRALFPALLALVLTVSMPAFAWGPLGHSAIGILAEAHLSPRALREATRLLRLEPADSLADVANWADQVRGPDQPWHSVRIPIEAPSYAAERDCKTRCVVGSIDDYLAQLSDRSLPDQQRLIALKYVVHLVGDVHQPLHAIAGAGREPVVWRGRPIQLHKLWDTSIIASRYQDGADLASDLAPLVRNSSACGTAAAWADESHKIAQRLISPVQEGSAGEAAIVVDQPYQEMAMGIIKDRLAKASERLACVLNKALN